MSAELPETFSIPETVLWQEVGDEIVLLEVHEGEYRSLQRRGQRDVAGARAVS